MTSNVIPMFSFNGTELRGLRIDGQPWFVANDAIRCLRLGGDASNHCRKLDADEKRVIETPKNLQGQGVAPRLTYVSRPGLFKLIQRSNKPEAREFDRWVRHEVLPQIMDNGGYVMRDADVQAVASAGGVVSPSPTVGG